MAYINEFVPEGEERSFLIPRYKKERTPGVWTIDKGKDYILFKYLLINYGKCLRMAETVTCEDLKVKMRG